MKTIKLLSIFIFLYGTVSAQQGSADIDLEKYLNKNVEYCDHVHGTYVTQGKNKVILLNLGAKYPDHRLVVAIFESDWKNFKYEPAEHLNNKDRSEERRVGKECRSRMSQAVSTKRVHEYSRKYRRRS